MKFTYANSARPVDGYTIQRGIHRGGFGEVYYALSDAGKEVALKLLTHDLDTELRGVQQCLNLKHPNLVTIFDVRTDAEGDRWVIMEYVQGASLDDVLASLPQGLPAHEVRDWLNGICAGVEYLHDRGIVHRDLKPANVYRENGLVKIGDVGLSKRMGGDRRGQHTESVGTIYYMAPEVAQGQYGPEVDVYSLAVMTFEMLTGKLPFDGETTAEILMKHLTSSPNLQPLPELLRPVVARALEKDPQKRTASVRQFGDEIRQALIGEPVFQTSAAALSAEAFGQQSGFAHYPTSPVPPPLPPAPPPPLKRDTDRAHDTSHTNGTRPVVERTSQSPLPVDTSPRSYRLRHTGQTTTRRPQPAADDGPSLHLGLLRWLPWFAVAAAFFIPWTRMSGGDAMGTVASLALWGGLFYAFVWWCTPAKERAIFRGTSSGLTGPLPNSGGLSFAEQLSGSLLLGTLLSGGLTYLSLLGMGWLDPPVLNGLTANTIGLMVAISALACGAVLSTGQLLPQRSVRVEHVRSKMAGLGAAIGAAAFSLDRFLLAQFPDLHDSSRSVFAHLGAHELWLDRQPTLVAYMVFFAGTLGLQNWRKLLDPYRENRLKVSAVLGAAMIGWLVSNFFGVPRPYAVVWAATITTAAQLAAPWQPGGNVRQVSGRAA